MASSAIRPTAITCRSALATAVAVALLAGCGGDGDDASPSTAPPSPRVAALLDRVPGESILVRAMDVGVARGKLGLPEWVSPLPLR